VGVLGKEDRWPRTLAYLDRLPTGVDSYPACTAKASVMLIFRQHIQEREDFGDLPEWLGELVRRPPLPSAWLPTVRISCVELMLVDELGEDAFFEFAQEANREYLGSPLYRAAVRVLSPAMLVRGAALRWRHFHRGTLVRAQQIEPTLAHVKLSYPDHLFDPVIAREKGMAFQAATELSGAKDVRCEVLKYEPGQTRFALSWSEG